MNFRDVVRHVSFFINPRFSRFAGIMRQYRSDANMDNQPCQETGLCWVC